MTLNDPDGGKKTEGKLRKTKFVQHVKNSSYHLLKIRISSCS